MSTLSLIQYNEKNYNAEDIFNPSELPGKIKEGSVSWINLEESSVELVDLISRQFNIHHLMVEDILNLDQLPKFELFQDYLFFNTKMLSYEVESKQIYEEHISAVMTKNLVITFQEGRPGDAFEPLRRRISLGQGKIRSYGADYLFYHILSAVVDNYLQIVEHLREKIEELEAESMGNPTFNAIAPVMELKKDINKLRKYALPMREALGKMRAEGSGFIQKNSINYYQDIADQLQHLVVSFETSREMLKDLMDLHHSNQNTEMNRVMKTLTVISAIFIPLTFVAGVYGMNFNHMPELTHSWGYPLAMTGMLAVAIGLAIYMRIKKWF